MPAALYRSIMKALDAWDYLQKTSFDEAEFIETFLDILRSAQAQPGRGSARSPCGRTHLTRCASARRCGAASASTCR
jgi:two-component system response regulator ChvI